MNLRKKIANFWYYNKTMVIVLVVSFLMIGYMELQYFRSDHEDYDIGVVSSAGLREEAQEALKARIEAFGEDRNGDRKIVTSLHIFPLTLGIDGEDAATIGALDADLVGKISGIYLLEDPEAFREATNGVQDTAHAVSVSETKLAGLGFDELYLYLREDLNSLAYTALYETLISK